MRDEDIMGLGRKHGLAMLADFKRYGAMVGEMLGVASFTFKGIMLYACIKSGLDRETIRKTFDQCLDVWLDDESETTN